MKALEDAAGRTSQVHLGLVARRQPEQLQHVGSAGNRGRTQAQATVVVEARERSGALITADFALEEGREVLACPGEITSALSSGTNALLRPSPATIRLRAWSPADVKSAIVNTASWTMTDHVNAAVDPGALTRGGGRVDLATATITPLTLDPASVSFGKWTGEKAVVASKQVTVENVSSTSQLCGVSLTGPTSTAGVSASSSSISLASGATTTITVSINAGKSLASGDYEGDLVLSCGERPSRPRGGPGWPRGRDASTALDAKRKGREKPGLSAAMSYFTAP